MIEEKDVEQYLDKPVRVRLINGEIFDGLYKYWQLEASEFIPETMEFYSLDGTDLLGGTIGIEVSEIESVNLLPVA